MILKRKNSESNHPVDTPPNIEALVNCLAAQPDVLAAYLFGSYATGRARPQSDVDVAVLLSGTDEMERFERRLRLIGESAQLLSALLEMARFRNLIVHNYARIEDAINSGIINRNLGNFDAFGRAIVEYLQSRTGVGQSISEER